MKTWLRRCREKAKKLNIILSAFIMLLFSSAGPAYSEGIIVMAKKVSGELSLDPGNNIWQKASPLGIPLAAQVMAKPRIYESKIKNLSVRALHNSKDIAFLVEWADDTRDVLLDISEFSDAVALEFPSSDIRGKPHFAMGDEENTSNIWYWKAVWQERMSDAKAYAAADNFRVGSQAGGIASKRVSPVENIIAHGFGSASEMEQTGDLNIAGSGRWQSNRWKVVFRRPLATQNSLNVKFKEGGVTPVAFAVWDGASGDRGGRKVISTWYYVGLETEEKKTAYIYPVIVLIAVSGIEAGLIYIIRKKRRH